MARSISADALAVIASGANYATRLNITPPGASAEVVEIEPGWSVDDSDRVAGPRLGIQGLQMLPSDDIDNLFDLAGYPGATYDLDIGINLGSEIEWIRAFGGYAADGTCRRIAGGVNVSLSDPWQYADIPFSSPLATTVDTRSNLIASVFTPVLPGLTVVSTATGGSVSQAGVYTGTRGQAASQLASDGLLRVGFNAKRNLVIKAQPAITSLTAQDWIFSAGDGGNIVAGTLERTRAWADTLVNAIAVVPGASWQPWSAQVAKLADTSDPRHESRIGLRGKEIQSNTASTAAEAMALAKQELARRLRATAERARWSTLLNPAVEAGDVCWVSALPVTGDDGWSNYYIATQVTHSPKAGTTQIEAVSAAGYTLA